MKISDILVYLLAATLFVIAFSMGFSLLDFEITQQWTPGAYFRFINTISFEKLKYCIYKDSQNFRYMFYIKNVSNNKELLKKCFTILYGEMENITFFEKYENKIRYKYVKYKYYLTPFFEFEGIFNKGFNISILDVKKKEILKDITGGIQWWDFIFSFSLLIKTAQNFIDSLQGKQWVEGVFPVAAEKLLAVDEAGNLYRVYILQEGLFKKEKEKKVEIELKT